MSEVCPSFLLHTACQMHRQVQLPSPPPLNVPKCPVFGQIPQSSRNARFKPAIVAAVWRKFLGLFIGKNPAANQKCATESWIEKGVSQDSICPSREKKRDFAAFRRQSRT